MSGGPSGGSTAVYSSENEHILYARDVKVRIRPVDREEYSTNLTLKLATQTSASRGSNGSNGGNNSARAGTSGALLITITDSKDPFFLYTLSLTEGDYHVLKNEQRLLVDFQNFPKMITELVAECAHSAATNGPSSGGQNMSVYLAVGESTVESTMSIIEANQFREITHLCLRMRKGTDDVIKHYLASKLNHFQHMAERLEETLCNTEKELRRVAGERQSQAEEISLMKAERCQLEQSLKAGYERELAEVSERHAREIRDNHNKLTAERDGIVKDLTAQLDGANKASKTATKSLAEAQEKIASLETSLGSSNRKLEAALKERDEDKERYGSSSAEVKRLEKENFTLEKQLSEVGVSLAMCKEQLATKEELASKSRELLEQANQQKASLEEQIQMYRTSLTQLEEKLSLSFKETTKGNEVIKKLQDQIKSYKSRVKGLKQSMQTHEETIHELDRRLLQEQRAHDDTKLEHKRALDALDRAHEDCDATRGKLDEAHKLLESNEQVISYLNKRLTDRDVKVLSGIEPGSSSSGGYSALSLPVLPSHRHHQQPQALTTSSSTSHHTAAGSSRSHSPSTGRLGGAVLSNRTNIYDGGGGAMQLSGSANSSSMTRPHHHAPPYHGGQRLASGFTIPGGSTTTKRPNFDDISAIGHQPSGAENQPPPIPSSSTTSSSASALQSRLAVGPRPSMDALRWITHECLHFNLIDEVGMMDSHGGNCINPFSEDSDDSDSRSSRSQFRTPPSTADIIQFDLTKGFPRLRRDLTLKDKAKRIINAIVERPLLHLLLLSTQLIMSILAAVFATGQLLAPGSPQVASYFDLSEDIINTTVVGYIDPTWPSVGYCLLYCSACILSILLLFHQSLFLPLQRIPSTTAAALLPFNTAPLSLSLTSRFMRSSSLICVIFTLPWRAIMWIFTIYLDYHSSWFWKRYILGQVLNIIIQCLAWLELGGIGIGVHGHNTQVAPPLLMISHSVFLSMNLISAPLLYYHGRVKLAVIFDTVIDIGYTMDALLALPYFGALFHSSKWYVFRHETVLVFLSSFVPLISVIMNLWQIDKLRLRGDPFAYNTHLNAGNARFSRLTKNARLRWIIIFIMLLVTSWALALLIVVHTIVTQVGTNCGPSFDPTASCRWPIRPIIGSCDCRIVIGTTHTTDDEKEGLSKCVSLPEMLRGFPRAEYLVITPTPKSLWSCAVDDDEVLWITKHMRSIRLLSLPYQNIAEYPKQTSMASLTSLSLPYNFLMQIDADILQDNKRLDHLSLEMNNLSQLPKEILSNPGGRLEYLSLMGNPLCKNREYYGALEDLRDRGISPLCGEDLWENRRITDDESRENGSVQPRQSDVICGASPRQDSLAFAMVYYKDACQLYRNSPSSECRTICDEVASWVPYISDGDSNLSLDEMNGYLELISIRPFTTDVEMECMLAYINCNPTHAPDDDIVTSISIDTIAVMMSGGVTDCKHCPYIIR